MPIRKIPIITNEYYHIFNRGCTDIEMFIANVDNNSALERIHYYMFDHKLAAKNGITRLDFSHYRQLSHSNKRGYLLQVQDRSKKLVEILAFVLMPNHFHLLVRQKQTDGIANFIRDFKNSYTQYYNTKYRHRGPLFEGRYHNVRIKDDIQLLHVSRYIHLNPYTAGLVTSYKDLVNYSWSSLRLYKKIDKKTYVSRYQILSHFSKVSEYLDYILERAEAQKILADLKRKLKK